MRVCSTVNLVAGFALVIAFAFAGCSNKPDAKTPETANTSTPGTSETSEPAGGGEKSGGEGGEKAGGEKTGGEAGGAKTGGGEAEGETRTTEVIAKIVKENRKEVRTCYDKARKSLPDLKGTVTIHFVLD